MVVSSPIKLQNRFHAFSSKPSAKEIPVMIILKHLETTVRCPSAIYNLHKWQIPEPMLNHRIIYECSTFRRKFCLHDGNPTKPSNFAHLLLVNLVSFRYAAGRALGSRNPLSNESCHLALGPREGQVVKLSWSFLDRNR